jgi:hypothetical protein
MCNDKHDSLLGHASFVLITCFFLCMVFVSIWFILFLTGGESGYALHARWFDLTKHDYVLLNYFGMAFVKVCAIVFFLFPYLSIRLLLRRKRDTPGVSVPKPNQGTS